MSSEAQTANHLRFQNTGSSFRKFSCFALTIFCANLVGCGGSGPAFQVAPPPPQVFSVTVSPSSTQLFTTKTQLFTAQVTGTGAFNEAVTWSVNGVSGGNSSIGTIVGGQYTAPASPPNPSNVSITATSVQNPSVSGSSSAVIYASAVLTSLSPAAATAGQQVTLDIQGLYGATTAVFTGPNGTTISMPVQQTSPGEITVTVPFGATTGPVYVNLTPFQGVNETTNSLAFARLPNLRIHASSKDLSSGETLPLDWRLLGASTTNVINWTADSGSITAQGVFQAPVVSSEKYSRVTGCVATTSSCDVILLRILPFRIAPASPIVNAGNTLQLDAVQGGSLLSPQWSVLAGGGSVMNGDLFAAPTAANQAGGVPVSATIGATTEQTSIAVSGAFAGQVNRVYDYADFTTYSPQEARFVKSVAVSGNRAYALTFGTPYQLLPSFEAIDVYDITNPDQPIWIDAVESATNSSATLFASGNTLFSIDSDNLVVYSLTTQVPALTSITPIASPFQWTLNAGVFYVLPYLNPNVTPAGTVHGLGRNR